MSLIKGMAVQPMRNPAVDILQTLGRMKILPSNNLLMEERLYLSTVSIVGRSLKESHGLQVTIDPDGQGSIEQSLQAEQDLDQGQRQEPKESAKNVMSL